MTTTVVIKLKMSRKNNNEKYYYPSSKYNRRTFLILLPQILIHLTLTNYQSTICVCVQQTIKVDNIYIKINVELFSEEQATVTVITMLEINVTNCSYA